MALKNTDCTWIEKRQKYRKCVKIGDKWHDVYGDNAKEIEKKSKGLIKRTITAWF